MSTALPVLGWKERVSLPAWGISSLRAKLDTGARSSALHVEDLTILDETGEHDARTGEPLVVVAFHVLVGSRAEASRVLVEAPTVALRRVRDTSATPEERHVVRTRIVCGPIENPAAEITLTTRHGMNFRMLLGRLTLERRCLVDPADGYLHTPTPPRPAGAS